MTILFGLFTAERSKSANEAQFYERRQFNWLGSIFIAISNFGETTTTTGKQIQMNSLSVCFVVIMAYGFHPAPALERERVQTVGAFLQCGAG